MLFDSFPRYEALDDPDAVTAIPVVADWARMDTRTLQVICEIASHSQVYSGQRLTATFATGSR